MTYARKEFGECDVTLRGPDESGAGYICEECSLCVGGDCHCATAGMMFAHLGAHTAVGEMVSSEALNRVYVEAVQSGTLSEEVPTRAVLEDPALAWAEREPPESPKLTRNAAKCLLCDTVIESKHVHDCVSCKCGNLFVDGGLEYLRRGWNQTADTWQDLSEPKPDSGLH